jgi:membrane protein DedA with SNARE-associated domain
MSIPALGVANTLVTQASPEQLTGIAGWITDLIDRFGSPGVGFVILLENLFPPIPSEAVLPAAGYLAGVGRLGFASALIWSTIGSVVGALVLYGVGALVGADRIARVVARLPLMSIDEVDRAWRTFDRWDRKAVFFGRLVPGVRSLISIPAGARRMPLLPFVALTAVGSFLWNLLLISAGYWLGDRWGETATVSHWANIGVLVAAVGACGWWIKSRMTRRTANVR